MRRTSALAAVSVAVGLLAVACDSSQDEPGAPQASENEHDGVEDAEIDVLALVKADGWRDELHRASFRSVVEIAVDRETAERAWADNVDASLDEAEGTALEPGIYADLEEVDFAQQAVVVFSSVESSSCPDVVTSVGPGNPITVDVVNASDFDEGPCTADQKSYRVLFAVDRDRLPDDEALPSHDVDDIDDDLRREYLVDLYPADL